MSMRLLISALPGETRAVWQEDGRLVDLAILRDDKPAIAGNIYIGRVTAIDKGLSAAFVEIGQTRPGFLPLDEADGGLSEGAAIIVRAVREPKDEKGARLTGRGVPANLSAAARRQTPPKLLRTAQDPIAVALATANPPDEIVTDDLETYRRATAVLQDRPELCNALRLDLDPVSLFEREGVEESIEALLDPRVELPSGGHLLIEPTRTLIAIDVNSGHAEGRSGQAAQALAVNLEAAREIPRQLRLRALSGLIVIDFLRLAESPPRRRVVAQLKQGLQGDPQPSRVFPMSGSGLVEMTRRRGRPALYELLTEPCGIGDGGRTKDPVTLAFDALRAIAREGGANPGRQLAVLVPARVRSALEDGPARPALSALEERLGRRLELRNATGNMATEIVLK